jgi:hypothetical protein
MQWLGGGGGAQSRNRTSDTRIFKTCVKNNALFLLYNLQRFAGVRKTVLCARFE